MTAPTNRLAALVAAIVTTPALTAAVRRRLRARAAVAAAREGTPYCAACQFPAQCATRGACARTGVALNDTTE